MPDQTRKIEKKDIRDNANTYGAKFSIYTLVHFLQIEHQTRKAFKICFKQLMIPDRRPATSRYDEAIGVTEYHLGLSVQYI